MLEQLISATAWPMTPATSRFGWYAATALYIPCVCFGTWLVFAAVRLLTRRSRGVLRA